MSTHRFFAAEEPASAPARESASAGEGPLALPLSEADRHHAARVLRLSAGDRIALVTPSRAVLDVVLDAVTPYEITGEVVGTLPAPAEPHLTLVQGLSRSAKLDLVVEKATELGVEAVWPVEFVRSVVRTGADPAKDAAKAERWRRVAEAAAKQSGRTFVPHVDAPADARGLLGRLAEFDRVLVSWEEAGDAPGIREALADLDADARVAVVVGPEGGLTSEEVAALQGAGATAVSLGDTILRTETAGIVAVTLAIHELGGLGASRA